MRWSDGPDYPFATSSWVILNTGASTYTTPRVIVISPEKAAEESWLRETSPRQSFSDQQNPPSYKYFCFTIRIFTDWISILKRFSAKFRVTLQPKHLMQFISLVVVIQRISSLNSRTISGVDWPIWTKDVMHMARSPLEVKHWSSADCPGMSRNLCKQGN